MADLNIPRDPRFYWPSFHAIQQKKHREIDWNLVAKTLENGEVNRGNKSNVWVFRQYHEQEEKWVTAIANIKNGRILTVAWGKEP